MNETEVEIPCKFWEKAVYPNAEGVLGCWPIIDAVPGQRELWLSITISTVLFQLALVAWTSHDIFRLRRAYLAKQTLTFWSNPLLWGQGMSCLCSLLMAIAYIDPWGLYGVYNHIAYLAIYAFPYGGIPAATFIISIYMFTVAVWKPLKKDQDPHSGLTIVGIVLISLVVIYAVVGYPIFGWVLAAAFKKNPETKLGPIGNYLAYTMYGLIMLVSLVVGIACNIVLSIYQKKIKRANLVLTRGRITKWCIVNFIASAFFLGICINYQFRSKDLSLMSTFIILGMSRAVEIIIQINTNTFQDSQYIEGGYCTLYFSCLTGRGGRVVEREGNESVTKTRLSTMGSSTKITKSSGGTTSHDSATDTV